MRGTWQRLRWGEGAGIRAGFQEMVSDLRPINSHSLILKMWLIDLHHWTVVRI